MEIYKSKYATPDQIDEIVEFANEGHTDALIAFGKDCVDGYNKALNNACLIGICVGVVACIANFAIKAVIKKRRESKDAINETETK